MILKDLIVSTNYIYINGNILPENEAHVSPFDRGFLYGDGIFETIRAENGIPEFLAEHITRLKTSAAALGITVPETDYGQVIGELLRNNGLASGTARVKIIITRGIHKAITLECSNPVTQIITAIDQAATRIPEVIGIYPEPRTDPLSKYKSLNYLFNLIARNWAYENGLDEAVLLGTDGEILECSMSNIFIEREKTIFKPLNQGYYLEGIMGEHLCKEKKAQGYEITEMKIYPDNIKKTDKVLITNSMIGICEVKIISDL